MNRVFLRCIAVVTALCLLLPASFAMAEGCGLGEAVTDRQGGVVPPQPRPQSAPKGSSGVSGAQEVQAAQYPSNSTEDLVARMYRVTLGREPDAKGLKEWTAALNDGTLSAADLVMGFIGSDEYRNSGRSNTQIVTDLYAAMLGRKPDSEGMKTWKWILDVGMSPRSVAAGFVGSKEFNDLANKYGIRTGTVNLVDARDQNFELTYFVYRLYANCLGRKPDTAGLESWCRELISGGSGANAAYGFVFSKEYLNKHVNNGDYVSMLYDTILGRQSDKNGYNSWKFVLDFSNTREKVLNGFLFSPEFQAQCQTAGISIGNPVGEPDQTDAWKNNIALLNMANAARAAEGKPLLHLREDLWRDVAMVRTSEIIEQFSHTRPDGRSCFTAWGDAGMTYWYAGENIAYGYASAESVFNAWMNSPGHRANLMDGEFEDFATGFIKTNRSTYWSQNFMTEEYPY